MRYWWLGTRPWHTIHNLSPWVYLLLFCSICPLQNLYHLIDNSVPISSWWPYVSIIRFVPILLLILFWFPIFLVCASYTFCASLAVAHPVSFFRFVSPIFLFHLLCCHQSLSTHSMLQLNDLPSSGHYKLFMWRCDGDLLRINLMFKLRMDASDSHLDNSIWTNSSKNVRVHLREYHSYTN